MYKISGDVIKVIKNTMKNWRVELTAGGKSLIDSRRKKVPEKDIPLIFGTAMKLLSHIFRKCTGGYKLHKL